MPKTFLNVQVNFQRTLGVLC